MATNSHSAPRDGPTLERFLDEARGPSRTLAVVDRSAPDAVRNLLERTFANQPVSVRERSHDTAEQLDAVDDLEGDHDGGLVVALDTSDEQPSVVATSPLRALSETILLVNSDFYRTGADEFESFALPDVLASLDEVPFHLRGYPASNREKLLLIAVSRAIEHRAWTADAGTLRAAFQRLSRIVDERGTRSVYERLAASGVETHAYGIPDWKGPPEVDVTVHTGRGPDYRCGWFVVYNPPEGTVSEGRNEPETEPAALLALERDSGAWEGFFTFRPSLVSALDDHIERAL